MKHVHRILLNLIPSRNAKQFLDGIRCISIRYRSSIYNHLLSITSQYIDNNTY